MTNIFLWSGAIGMFCMLVLFYILGKKLSPSSKTLLYLMMAVPSIACVAYIFMALGIGVTYQGTSTIYLTRYIDWLFTTPILMIILSSIALKPITSKKLPLIIFLILLDIVMILTGAVAGYLEGVNKIIFFILSSIAYLGMLIILLKIYFRYTQEMSLPVNKMYTRLRILVLVTWSIYPIIWGLSSQGFIRIFDLETEIGLFMIVDLFSKGFFGYYLLTDTAAIEASSEEILN